MVRGGSEYTWNNTNSTISETDAFYNAAGTIQIGGTETTGGRLDYTPTSTTVLSLDNTYNSANAKTQFGMRSAGTRLTCLEINGDKSVTATSANSGNLKQVARVHNSTSITVGTTAAANGSTKTIWNILHNLGTANVVVSVREGNASVGSRTQVETTVHAGEMYSTSASAWQANVNYAAIEFASAPADNTVFDVTVIG